MTPNTQLSQEDLRKLLKESHIHCLVGYGLSGECGIPTFNDLLRGVWSVPTANWNPFVSERNREWVLNELNWKKALIRSRENAVPYRVLSLLQELFKLEVATQCVDGLIGYNGVKQPVELFGNVFANRCHECGEYFPRINSIDLQSCTRCGGTVWPDIAMFGWNDHHEIQEAWRQRLPKDGLLLQIGADLLLMPYGNAPANKELHCRMLELTINEFRYVTETGCKSVLKYADVRKAIKMQPQWPSNLPMEKDLADSGMNIGLHYLLWLTS